MRLAYVPYDDSSSVGNAVSWDGLSYTVKKLLSLRWQDTTVLKMLVSDPSPLRGGSVEGFDSLSQTSDSHLDAKIYTLRSTPRKLRTVTDFFNQCKAKPSQLGIYSRKVDF